MSTLFVADAGVAPEPVVVRDLLRRALPAAPVVVGLAALRGLDGAASAAFAIVLVLANFALAAASLAWSARVSLALLMGVALFGYVARLGVLFVAVLAIRDHGWVDMTALGLTLVAAHLGLLLWELRYVSASLAFPALKPQALTPTAPKERSR